MQQVQLARLDELVQKITAAALPRAHRFLPLDERFLVVTALPPLRPLPTVENEEEPQVERLFLQQHQKRLKKHLARLDRRARRGPSGLQLVSLQEESFENKL